LAGNDERRLARRYRVVAKTVKSTGDNDDDQQREDGDQIDLPWVMTVMADFPAHDWLSLRK
jgi:hypothetical protein